ncbi:MAG: sulfate adenylyltransferase [Candidatus Eisenbacteria bacterium]|nr:sulfate adenylyltransferase [Candidatus Eisenbacteria bacterium]
MSWINPHGGRLINRLVPKSKAQAIEERAPGLPRITLNPREMADIEMIAVGAMSPLEGFMVAEDYDGVVERMHLAKGLAWTIPITLSVTSEQGGKISEGDEVALHDPDGTLLAVMEVQSKYKPDKMREAEKVLRTTHDAHPGVQYLKSIGDFYLGGPLTAVRLPEHRAFNEFRLTPRETRVLFKAKGWETVAAFQTRNPIHRAHEYLQKCALEIVDGLLIHPLMGATKADDIPGPVRWDCYDALLNNYYPKKDRVAISVFPAAMRYAGPSEAIWHAIVRKNYGCTHLIVGRDHAGVGKYYGTYDAQHIFKEFSREEIGLTPLYFEHAFYCRKCGNMASIKTCPHGNEEHVFLSGTKVREMLSRGEAPPAEFTRPEVARVLLRHAKQNQPAG